MRAWAAGVAGVMLAAGAAGAAGQDWHGGYQEPEREHRSLPRLHFDLALLGASPIGEFGELVDAGFGGQLALRARLGDRSPLLLRVDGGLMVYGHERRAVCFPVPIGCRIGADLTTTNAVGYMGVGPEVEIPGQLRPYVYGTVGFAYFATTSSLDEYDGSDGYFRTRNYSDLVASGRLGGGLRLRFGGPGTAALDLGVEYHRNGVAEYLRKGDILDHPDGSITLFPNRTEANFMTFRLGLAIPVGHRP